MQRLEVSGAVRLIYSSLGVKGLNPRKSFKIIVFWDVTPCTLVGSCCFRTHYCLRHQDLPKRRGTYTGLHDVTRQQTAVLTVTTVGTSGIRGGAVG